MKGNLAVSKTEWQATLTIPGIVVSLANLRGGWARRASIIKKARDATRLAWLGAGKPTPPAWPISVTLCRVSSRLLDSDNLVSALKPHRDEIAGLLGLRNDAGKEVDWRYSQVTNTRLPPHCHVTLRCEYDSIGGEG